MPTNNAHKTKKGKEKEEKKEEKHNVQDAFAAHISMIEKKKGQGKKRTPTAEEKEQEKQALESKVQKVRHQTKAMGQLFKHCMTLTKPKLVEMMSDAGVKNIDPASTKPQLCAQLILNKKASSIFLSPDLQRPTTDSKKKKQQASK